MLWLWQFDVPTAEETGKAADELFPATKSTVQPPPDGDEDGHGVAEGAEGGRFEHFHNVRFELIKLKVAPRKTRCPDCGHGCHRRHCEERAPIYDVSLDGLRVLLVTVGVYECKRPGCDRRYFRKALPFAPPRGRYTVSCR